MDDRDTVRRHNSAAWDLQVEQGNPWTVPVGPEAMAAARRGELKIPYGAAGLSSSVVVRGLATVPVDIAVTLQITHSRPSDLRITLTDPNSVEATVWNQTADHHPEPEHAHRRHRNLAGRRGQRPLDPQGQRIVSITPPNSQAGK